MQDKVLSIQKCQIVFPLKYRDNLGHENPSNRSRQQQEILKPLRLNGP